MFPAITGRMQWGQAPPLEVCGAWCVAAPMDAGVAAWSRPQDGGDGRAADGIHGAGTEMLYVAEK
ncbi:MAG TPA: hypothetical protein VHI13_10440 [Candidatus Kapabacteria bacterium]|nr:hypothetical protein [Candidatus Kapabacteria bacterium]